MKRPARLMAAKHWLPTYQGKNIVHGYRKHYGLDVIGAITELTLLGIAINPAFVTPEKLTLGNKAAANAAKKLTKAEQALLAQALYCDQDAEFYYIAGYTSGDVPYGTTWAELGLAPFEDDDERFF